MLEYVIVINGTALDRTAGFLYDVNEVKVIHAINDADAYNQTKGIKEALEKGDTIKFAKLMDKHWRVKRKREGTTAPKLERWYEIAKKNGAIGGKVMGAGGGGFFAFYAEGKKEKLRKAGKRV